jgi:predicted nucleic acid-binding protein
MRYLYDTNIFIYYLVGEAIVDSLFAEDFLNLHDILMSVFWIIGNSSIIFPGSIPNV